MRRAVLLLLAGLALAAPPAHASTTGRLLVTLDEPSGTRAHAAAAHALAASTGARLAGPSVPQINLVSVRPPAGTGIADFARSLRAQPGVAHVEAERRYAPRVQPNDPALTVAEPGAPAGTPVQWWAQRQGLFEAWDVTRGATATVAVIDTGFDANHPEFAGKIRYSIDYDGGGGATVTDEFGHGTHVASLACAASDNATALAGTGLGCGLMLYKTGLGTSSVAATIVDAADRGADAINMSFGEDGAQTAPRAIVDAIDFAYNKGVLMAAAAADQPVDEQGDPANILQPTGTGQDISQGKGLSVTAANFNDERASFAGRGSQISIAAYGAYGRSGGPRGIFGAFPGNETEIERGTTLPPAPGCQCRTTFNGDNRYAYIQGTSMATPMVAAAGALVRNLNPDLSIAEVIRIMKNSARRPAGSSWGPELGWGILDAGAAVRLAAATDRRAPASKVKAPSRTHRRSITLRLSGSDTAPVGVVASGIKRFELHHSVDGGTLRKFASTTKKRHVVRARPGRTYRFYSVAVDVAGNREAAPAKADASVRVARDAR